MSDIKECSGVSAQFIKITGDFYNDMLNTFPEFSTELQALSNEYGENNISNFFNYCKTVYPERFFDLLYQNEDIFSDDSINTKFLPNIDFGKIWSSDISDKTKLVIWKYLQLICFCIVNNEKSSETFGDTAALFEAINEDELKSKLNETILKMGNLFDSKDGSGNPFDNMPDLNFEDASGEMPDPDKLHEHISGLLDGKLGRLANEITENTIKGLGDISGVSSVNDVFQVLFKDPGRLFKMIKNISGSLDEKIKSGEIKESELMEEAGQLMSKLNNMPGMKGMQKMMSEMGMSMGKNSKINMGAMKSNLQKTINASKTKERLRKKLESKKATASKDSQIEILEKQLAEARAENARNELLLNEERNKISKKTKGSRRGKGKKKSK